MYIQAYDETPIEQLSPICQEMAKKISKLTLFPLLNDLVIFHKFSDFTYVPSKIHGLFISTLLPSFAHEISHTVEVGIDRITKPDWGISIDKCVTLWKTSKLFTALAREIRVRSIEQYIEPGISKADRNHIAIFDNITFHKELQKRLPYDRFRNLADVVEWGHFQHKIAMRDWNLERIVSEWDKRAEILNNWMESA